MCARLVSSRPSKALISADTTSPVSRGCSSTEDAALSRQLQSARRAATPLDSPIGQSTASQTAERWPGPEGCVRVRHVPSSVLGPSGPTPRRAGAHWSRSDPPAESTSGGREVRRRLRTASAAQRSLQDAADERGGGPRWDSPEGALGASQYVGCGVDGARRRPGPGSPISNWRFVVWGAAPPAAVRLKPEVWARDVAAYLEMLSSKRTRR